MEKKDLAKYSGKQVYALCRRMGGEFKDIDCLTVYEITDRGTLLYVCEVMSCVANKQQWAAMVSLTDNNYIVGRPTAAKISKKDIDRLVH